MGNDIEVGCIDDLQVSALKLDISKTVLSMKASGRLAPMRLTNTKPRDVVEILYLWSLGASQTKLVKKYGFSRATIQNVLLDYSDKTDGWREIAGDISARSWLDLSSLEEDVIVSLRERMENGEIEVSFRDLKEVSYAKLNSGRDAMAARGHASSITEHKVIYSAEDYEETARRAKERLEALKEARDCEIIDVDE